MRLLILSLNFAPEAVGIGKYSGELAQWLAQRGHAVTVLCAPPYYPQWQLQTPYRNRFQTEQTQGVVIRRAPLYVPRRPTTARRLLHLASFSVTVMALLLAQLQRPPQRLVVVAPAFFSTLPALLFVTLCRWRRRTVPTLLHIQDFELDAAYGLGLLRNSRLRTLAAGLERAILRRFDAVSTISAAMARRLRHKGVEPSAIRLFPNWVDCNLDRNAAAPAQVRAFRGELGIPEQAVVALYAGSMNRKQGIEILAQAARVLSHDPSLWWLFCGEGPSRPALEQGCVGLPQVRFLPQQPDERFRLLLLLADLHLLPQQAGAADLVMPSKLLAMLASGRPVVATAKPGTNLAKALQSKPAAGVVTPPGDADQLAQAVAELAANPSLRAELGSAAQLQARRRWQRERVLLRFERDLLRLEHPAAAHQPHQ